MSKAWSDSNTWAIWKPRLLALVVGAIGFVGAAVDARAGDTWNDLKPDVFGDRPIVDGSDIIRLEAPHRPEDQRAVPVRMRAVLRDGRTIKSVTFVLDENPMPVSAVFNIGGARSHVELGLNFRLGRKTDVRAIVEASDGTLYMVERFVNFAGGQSACTAPPEGDPAEILANMGMMSVTHAPSKVAATLARPKARLDLSHPNHTGMVLDPIKLHYTPMRMVQEIEVRQGGELVFSMSGSITLSQDPSIEFDYKVNGETQLNVTAKDSDETVWERTFAINQGS